MRILQVIQQKQLRGAEMFASQLSGHLVKQGHEVIIVALFPGDADLPFTGQIRKLDANKKKRFWNLSAYRRLAHIIKEFNPDIVQANASDSLKYSVFSKMLFRWKQPIVFRNASMISRYMKSKTSLLVNRFLMKRVSMVISVSETTRKDFIQIFPFLKDHTSVVPIGIELQEQHTSAASPVKNIYAHVGGFSFEKNHKGLINIFSAILKDQPGAMLWLIGDGPLRSNIEQYVHELGIQDNVVFWGNRNDVSILLCQAKAMLLTSIIEGLPAVILESFYCKVPVISYNVGAVSELVKNGETGFLVNINDEEAFVLAVNNMEHQPLSTITSNAHNTVINSFTNQKIATQLVKIFESNLN